MEPSIGDVARAAGVSTASVSRSLRGLSGVSEVTRSRVENIARELGYAISPGASSLRSGRTGNVAVVTPFVDRWFFGRALGGVESVLQDADHRLVLYSLHGSSCARQRLFADRVMHRKVDAVLVMCLALEAQEVEALRSLNVPVALLGARAPGFWSVGINDFGGAQQAVRHLIHLGHERIAFIGGSRDEPLHFTAPVDRRKGYLQTLNEAGLEVDSSLDIASDFTVSGGDQAMAALLGLTRPPTAVFAASDEMAFGALRVLRDSGLRVPQDISIIGFDDHEMSHLVNLTTITQPVAQLGAAAAQALVDTLEQLDRPAAETFLPTRLTVRGTTGPPRITM